MQTISTNSFPARRERDPDDEIIWLESWHDPTPRPSSMTVKEFMDHCVACGEREMIRRRQEEDRNALLIALQTYAKQNNMQPSELELVEVKERNLFGTPGFVHFNFLVRGSDGTLSLFFAEVRPDCRKEEHVHLCTPLDETDSGHCFGCNHLPEKLIHPTSGGYLGGHKDACFTYVEDDDLHSSDLFDCWCYG